MKKIDTTIRLLKNVIKDKNCERMSRSTIIGYLGELLSIQKVEKEGKETEHAGKQKSYDFACDDKRIEVKTSLRKDDLKLGFKYWGWGLKHSNKKKISATHFICLALDDKFRPYKYFIFNANDLKLFPRGAYQYKKLERVFHYGEGNHKIANAHQRSSFIKSKELIRRGKIKMLGKNGNLSRLLASH